MFNIIKTIFGVLIIIVLGFSTGCSKPSLLSEKKFTETFAEACRREDPKLKIQITEDLALKVEGPDEVKLTIYLDNAYQAYQQNPDQRDAIIKHYIDSALKNRPAENHVLDRAQIVPIIKTHAWLEGARQTLKAENPKELPNFLYDELNSDLIIAYAEDSSDQIRYLSPKDLEEAKIDRAELRKIACTNLERILPKIQRQGDSGVYALIADGTYEASLLLLDSVWREIKPDVKGDVIVAIPSRDLLLVTGSQDPAGIVKLKLIAQQVSTESPYSISPKLFIYRDGNLVEYTDRATSSGH